MRRMGRPDRRGPWSGWRRSRWWPPPPAWPPRRQAARRRSRRPRRSGHRRLDGAPGGRAGHRHRGPAGPAPDPLCGRRQAAHLPGRCAGPGALRLSAREAHRAPGRSRRRDPRGPGRRSGRARPLRDPRRQRRPPLTTAPFRVLGARRRPRRGAVRAASTSTAPGSTSSATCCPARPWRTASSTSRCVTA